MKKNILTTLIAVAATGAFAQGTVTFLNDTGTLTSPPDRFIRFGYGPFAGQAAFGTNLLVQLYYGASTAPDSSMVAVSSAPGRLRASTSPGVGTWSAGGSRTLSGFDFGSGTVHLQVRLWDVNFGATYEAALANPNNIGLIGTSAAFNYSIPATAADPPGNFIMANFVGFSIGVPEPSTFALAVLGAGALLLFRRRK